LARVVGLPGTSANATPDIAIIARERHKTILTLLFIIIFIHRLIMEKTEERG
jgi:hypothetical protein